ncbi:MAG: hypothetical protein RLY58_1353 [Pseudomonadota bacterium]|jgi:hypothetical protein
MDTATLLWGVVFGSVGLGFSLYGKKQQSVVPFACGLLLMFLPYAVTNVWALVVLGSVLMAIPYFVRW